jgi:hypothetical protein
MHNSVKVYTRGLGKEKSVLTVTSVLEDLVVRTYRALNIAALHVVSRVNGQEVSRLSVPIDNVAYVIYDHPVSIVKV